MKRANFNIDRKTLYMVLGIILVSVFSLTVAYAALNTILNITGSAEVIASNWDIHLGNIQVKSGSVGGVVPKIINATTATFSTKLTTPGDFYEFSIDVVNDGTIDAMIDSVTKTPTLSESQAKYLNYIIEYENGNMISTKQLVKADSFVRLRVRVEYRKDITASDLPTSNESLSLSFTVNYVQSDNSGNTVINNGTLKAMVKNGTGTDVGDEICIGNECFYVISSTDEEVTMLAKYNLHVGNKYDGSSTVPLENPTGIQNSNAIGWFGGYTVENLMIGTIPFSNAGYWNDTVDVYPKYVYNENSFLYQYVENYKDYLEGLGTTINDARLLSLDETENLGCLRLDSCESSPSWVYSTSYWLGTAKSVAGIWRILSNGAHSYNGFDSNGLGVRPVIAISKDQILGIRSKVKPVANGSLDEIGTVVTIGSEQFYTIGTEGDNVKLLAKYNLLVGNKYDDTNKAVPLQNPTGVQDETAKGWFSDFSIENPMIGTKAFASTNYWSGINVYPSYVYNENSYLYEYVENYKNYLENFGITVISAKLISIEELEGLGCSRAGISCSGAPSWVYSTTYWSGAADSSTNLWYVSTDSYFRNRTYANDSRGVRPVITISRSLF